MVFIGVSTGVSKFRKLGTDRYWVPADKKILGSNGYRVAARKKNEKNIRPNPVFDNQKINDDENLPSNCSGST